MTRFFRGFWALGSALCVAACAAPSAPPNPNSVPAVLQSLTEARGQFGAIFITGGLYSGAASGQTARFVVTPDDGLICTFQSDPETGSGGEIEVTAHRLNLPGIYAAMGSAVLPNITTQGVEFTTNFTVEFQTGAGVSRTQTGFGDPRATALFDVFTQYPTPCWAFG